MLVLSKMIAAGGLVRQRRYLTGGVCGSAEHDAESGSAAVAGAVDHDIFSDRRNFRVGCRHRLDRQQRGNTAVFRSHESLGVHAARDQAPGNPPRYPASGAEIPLLAGGDFRRRRRFCDHRFVTQFNTSAVITLFSLNFLRPAFAGWLVDSFRWLLVAGNLIAITVGIMLAFFPDALSKLEARGSGWVSERQAVRGADAMHNTLDTWVAAHPRAAGAIIGFFALALIGAFGLLLPGIR